MKQGKLWVASLILLAIVNVPAIAQDAGAEDLMTLDEGDMNSILDELIGSMGGETEPTPVMEAQSPDVPEPTQPPEESMMQAESPAPEAAPVEAAPIEEAVPMEGGFDSGAGEFGMGADDMGSMGASAAGADAQGEALPDGFEPIGEVPEGTPDGEFGMGADDISNMGTADADPVESTPESIEPTATEPAPESLIEGGDYAQSEAPMEVAPEPDSAPEYNNDIADSAPMDIAPIEGESMDASPDDTSLAQSNYDGASDEQATDFGQPSSMGSMTPAAPGDFGEVQEPVPTAEEIRNRSVAIAKEEHEQLLITVGDKVYMPIPTFKTPQVKDSYTIYKGSKKKIFRNQPNTMWYKKIGKLRVVEVSNLYVLGVVMAANDIIQQGDVVYIKP